MPRWETAPDGTKVIRNHPFDSEGDASFPCATCGEMWFDHAAALMDWVKRQKWSGPVEARKC